LLQEPYNTLDNTSEMGRVHYGLLALLVVTLVSFQLGHISYLMNGPRDISSKMGAPPFKPAHRKWAYIYLLEECDPDNPKSYLPFLYHILVSAKILQLHQSKADVVVLVEMKQPGAILPSHDTSALAGMKIGIRYLPSLPHPALKKLYVLTMLDYSRVLYLEGMPMCNLDYMFELSEPRQRVAPKLKPNVILSWHRTPSWDAFFLLAPQPGDFEKLLEIVDQQQGQALSQGRGPNYFDAVQGWGHVIETETELRIFEKVTSAGDGIGLFWTWEGADSTSGLLLYWTRYYQHNVSIIVQNQVEQWGPGDKNNHTEDDVLLSSTCLPEGHEYTGHYAENCPQAAGRVPYRDFMYFGEQEWRVHYHSPKPWETAPPKPVSSKEDCKSAVEYWYFILGRVEKDLNMNY
jgi:hypothetical protein